MYRQDVYKRQVYAVPVTRCGPHSFCRVELLAEGCAAALRLKFSGMLHEVRITPVSYTHLEGHFQRLAAKAAWGSERFVKLCLKRNKK